MPGTNSFQFVNSDLPFLQHTYQLRLASIDHLAALTGRSYKRTAERLAKLSANAYLKCVARKPNTKIAYGIGHQGVALLVEHGYAQREIVAQRLRQHELKDLGIRHSLFIADIHVKLLLLTQERSLVLSDWVEGSSLWDTVVTSNQTQIPIRPDARFTIDTGTARSHFYLEADRGSMAHSRMREKCSGYAAYFQQQRHLKKHPQMKTFRVATITETRGRARSLAEEFRAMMPVAWLAAYPVIAVEDLTIATLLPELGKV